MLAEPGHRTFTTAPGADALVLRRVLAYSRALDRGRRTLRLLLVYAGPGPYQPFSETRRVASHDAPSARHAITTLKVTYRLQRSLEQTRACLQSTSH